MNFIHSILIVFFLLFVKTNIGQSQDFTKQQIQEDLTYLKEQLLEKHPNLRVYSSNIAFQNFFKNIEISKQVTATEVYSLIASASTVIKDGHTLFYPDFQLINENNETGYFIPLSIFWNGKELFIRENYSGNKEVRKGTKIISINGIASEKMIDFMLQRMMRDGNNFNYPIWVLNQYFFEYYSYFYGCPKEFHLVLETDNKKQEKLIVKGLLKAELLDKIKSKKTNQKAISIGFDESESIAVLRVEDWHNNVLRKYYRQNFKKEIIRIFEQIKARKVENLIIDVRDNQGGDTQNSKLLLSYLLDQSFELVKEYKVIKNGELVKAKGPQMGWHQPKKENFNGNLVVLINGGSFSNTGIFCSVLRKHNRAIFIGAETGGSEFVICSSPKTLTLPNTKIQAVIPRLQFLIKGHNKSELSGIKPDHIIKPTIESLTKGKDIEKEFAIQLIKQAMQP